MVGHFFSFSFFKRVCARKVLHGKALIEMRIDEEIALLVFAVQFSQEEEMFGVVSGVY